LTALNLEVLTEYHQKKLRREIEFREMLKKEFEKLATIQDSGREIRLR